MKTLLFQMFMDFLEKCDNIQCANRFYLSKDAFINVDLI